MISKTDSSVKGLKSKKIEPLETQFIGDKIIKNTYKTLMTQAMKGCYIYCIDKELGEYLKNDLQKFNTK
ncbi:DNA/RNA helicase domain-containing protein [Spiroplasma sabaudiense]|uniref:DNA/RNA helicase domain-containing protein n=1 Tax=Spiroplasma sabaudiense TaxID=216944 RepID=UPI00046CCBBC